MAPAAGLSNSIYPSTIDRTVHKKIYVPTAPKKRLEQVHLTLKNRRRSWRENLFSYFKIYTSTLPH